LAAFWCLPEAYTVRFVRFVYDQINMSFFGLTERKQRHSVANSTRRSSCKCRISGYEYDDCDRTHVSGDCRFNAKHANYIESSKLVIRIFLAVRVFIVVVAAGSLFIYFARTARATVVSISNTADTNASGLLLLYSVSVVVMYLLRELDSRLFFVFDSFDFDF
jgi:hypothetical protein